MTTSIHPQPITLRKIDSQYLDVLQGLLDAAPSYYMKIDGVPNAGSAKELFEELPPNCTYDNKHVLLIEQEATAIGVIDLIIGYPDSKTAFIGLLVLDEKFQGKGLGLASYKLLEEYIAQFKISSIELGVNDTNDVGMAFWSKLSFTPNGRTRINKGKRVTSTVIVLHKHCNK
jgi:RimJ/RimL family protein N-acetyltransferase